MEGEVKGRGGSEVVDGFFIFQFFGFSMFFWSLFFCFVHLSAARCSGFTKLRGEPV